MKLAVLGWAVGRPASLADFAARLDTRIGEAAGADLLLLPEYACMELALGSGARAELADMVGRAAAVLGVMRDAAIRHRLWLQPGTLPMSDGGRIVNRAPLIRPDGSLAFQDKWHMTRFETEQWGVSRGAPPSVFDTPWGRIGISVCYDAEFPKHVRAQVEAGAWLVLVPACTDTPHGAARVAISARARAVENQCYVAVAPTLGARSGSVALDTNHGEAAIYGPADEGFATDGVVAAGGMDQPGWVIAEIDEAAITQVREHGAVRNHHDWPRAPMPAVLPAVFA